MKCDVLIIYEHRAREIENACLLAVELEKRGYKVAIKHVQSFSKYFIKAKVVVAPHLYNDFHVLAIAKNFWKSHKNLISLQYEQVIRLPKDGKADIHDPKGEAVNAQHIAWGKAQEDRYIKFGINPKNVHTIGNMAMDLMKPEFSSYFITRDGLSDEFNIDSGKEWVLFISSFSYANRTKQELIAYAEMNPNAFEFSKISSQSQEQILNWLLMACQTYPEKLFIYRPHPAEKLSNESFKELCQLPNFKIISKYSIRQWVKSCDKLYTWYSTSIVDAYFAGKTCFILRPVDIPEDLEVEVMRGAKHIIHVSDFIDSLNGHVINTDINGEIIKYYYGVAYNIPAYLQLADLCEKMMDGSMQYNYHYKGSCFNIQGGDSIRSIFSTFCYNILCDISDKIDFSFAHSERLLHFRKESLGITKEINDLKTRFRKVL